MKQKVNRVINISTFHSFLSSKIFFQRKIGTLTLLRNKIQGHTSKLFTVCTLTGTTDRLISSDTQLGAGDWQQTSRAGLRYWWVRWSSLFQQRQREFVRGASVPPEPLQRVSACTWFHAFRPPVTAALPEKNGWRQQHSLAQVQRGEKKFHHFMRNISIHDHCNRTQTPAQITFDIQTLLHVQFISSNMEKLFPGKTASIFYKSIFSPRLCLWKPNIVVIRHILNYCRSA